MNTLDRHMGNTRKFTGRKYPQEPWEKKKKSSLTSSQKDINQSKNKTAVTMRNVHIFFKLVLSARGSNIR